MVVSSVVIFGGTGHIAESCCQVIARQPLTLYCITFSPNIIACGFNMSVNFSLDFFPICETPIRNCGSLRLWSCLDVWVSCWQSETSFLMKHNVKYNKCMRELKCKFKTSTSKNWIRCTSTASICKPNTRAPVLVSIGWVFFGIPRQCLWFKYYIIIAGLH